MHASNTQVIASREIGTLYSHKIHVLFISDYMHVPAKFKSYVTFIKYLLRSYVHTYVRTYTIMSFKPLVKNIIHTYIHSFCVSYTQNT